ncbi:MAG TPA: hypothetical protein VF128_14815 [Gemmatimonadaceae bacterium]
MNDLSRRVFRPIGAALATGTALLVVVAFKSSGELVAQSVEFTIRPTWDTNVVLVGNPIHARDTSELSAAGGSWGRVCHTDCTTPIVATATWQRIPGGYRPLRLEVKWRLASSMALYGNDVGKVKGTLEYNLGSGWQSWIEYTWFGTSATCPTPSNGGITCPDHMDTLPLPPTQRTDTIQVRVTESVELTHCDNCWIRVSNAQGSLSVFDIRVKADECYFPTDETTVGEGWDTADPTMQKFMQTLIPDAAGRVYDGRTVMEQSPGPGGPDTCHRPGDTYDAFEAITGGTWTVNSGNKWGYDYVGYHSWVVDYYRARGRAPCGTSFPQEMVINCGTTNVIYTSNTLRAGFDEVLVWSERDGVQQQRVY